MAKAFEIRDTFNDNQTNTSVWSSYGITRETNQRVEAEPDPDNYYYSGYYTMALHDLRGSQVSLEVLQTLNPAPGSFTYLQAKYENSNDERLGMETVNGQLFAVYWVAGAKHTAASVAYSASQHRWWRIRERAGRTYFETSPDGCDWNVLADVSIAVRLDRLEITFGVGTEPATSNPGTAIFDNFNVFPLVVPIPDRRQQAQAIRNQAASIARDRPHPDHLNNGEECDYPYVANYSKGLQHDSLGDVLPASYQSLLTALASRNSAAFEQVLLGPGGKKLTNPQAGLAFDLEGPDTHAVTQPPAPRIDSPQNSAEMAELYWMALARDVHFADYGSSAVVQQAIQSLNSEFSDFRGPRQNGLVTTQTV
ncbi:MAG TPA: hypothetical protein VHG51_14445, partial [Longimicrobiaceae bacterium]|nr:hypothetical protein [Longimicrobiaceae bacterium]